MQTFYKMQGIGNDFVVMLNFDGKLNNKNFSLLAKKLCKRHFFVGADGLCIVNKHKTYDAKIDIYNSDGTQADFCGNATRCIALLLSKLLHKNKLSLCYNKICVMAKVQKNNVLVEMPKYNKISKTQTKIANKVFTVNKICVPNKHLVVFVKNFGFDINKYGNQLQKQHKGFNVDFVKIENKNLKLKVYENGAKRTLGCGSGAVASCIVYNKLSGQKNITVCLDGGQLKIRFFNNKIYMFGNAKFVYKGSINI